MILSIKTDIHLKNRTDMRTYEPMPGEHINETAKSIVDMAKESKETVTAVFNDITLTANEGDTEEGIVKAFEEARKQRAEAYRNSPEGKKAAREIEERQQQMQKKHDALMQKLTNLDFNNDVEVLDWLCEFQGPSDHIGVSKQQDVVVATFAKHGYHPNVNLGDDYNSEDRENVKRAIVGQALGCLQGEVGAIHQVIHRFVDDWKKKWGA